MSPSRPPKKRFHPKNPGEPADLDPNQGFSRFTQRARNVVVAAQNEARTAGSAEIAPGHLVLGLLSEPDAIAAQAIISQGVTLDRLRDAVAPTLPSAAEQVPDLIPFDP